MKILFLCNKSPWPPKEGGPMAMYMLIEGLLNAGHEVKVIAINSYKYNIDPKTIPIEFSLKTNIEFVTVDLRIKPFRAFLNLFTGRSYHIERFISNGFRQKLTEILQRSEFDIVQLETLSMGPYIHDIRKYSRAKIVLRAHNIEHLIWQRVADETRNPLKRWYLNHLAVTLKKYEIALLNKVDGIAAITPNDADFFRKQMDHGEIPASKDQQQASHIPVTHITFGVDPAAYPIDPEKAEYPSLFTIGAMNWIPNQEGIRWFLQNVWIDIHNQFPTLKYYLAGREMPEWMRSLNLPNVIVMGEVENAVDFISSKAIMIVPLFSGSGIRIKIIEGMAAGKIIISTALGAEGIDCTNHKDILLANLPCEFFDMISICMADRKGGEMIGKNARKLVETTYNRDLIIRKLEAFYQQIAG